MPPFFHQFLFGSALVNSVALFTLLGFANSKRKKYRKRVLDFLNQHDLMYKDYQYRHRHRIRYPRNEE